MRRFRKAFYAILCAALVLSAAGCGGTKPAAPAPGGTAAKTPAGPPVKVRFSEVVHSIFYAPFYAAVNRGFFKDENLDVDVRTDWGTDRGTAALISGNADIAMVGPESAIYTSNQGVPVPLLIFAQLTTSDGGFLVARKPMANFKWDDVRGKTIIAYRPGGMPEMVLEYVLQQNRLQPQKDVNLVTNLAFNATAGAFAGGQGEFVALFEPTASEMEAKGLGSVVASMGTAGPRLPYTVFVASQKYMDANPDVIERFTRAILRGMDWVAASSAQDVSAAVSYAFPETPRDILARVVERYQKQASWAQSPVPVPEHFDRLQEVMISGGVLKPEQRVKLSNIATSRFAEAAVKSVRGGR